MKNIRTVKDIVYSESGMKLDIYLPADAAEPLPTIVWIHGGAWRVGSKEGSGGNKPPAHLAEQGYVVASIDYRLSHEAVFPAQIHDCKAAIRWLRAHAGEYHIDPERIGVWGRSAGAHLAALLGTSAGIEELEGEGGCPECSSSVQAVCDFFGPTDLLRLSEMKGEVDKESPESLVIGGHLPDNIDKVVQANPLTYIKSDSPPFLIVHGDADTTVLPDQSHILHQTLSRAGVETEMHTVPGAGHGFEGATGEQLDEINRMVEDFFDRHLKAD